MTLPATSLSAPASPAASAPGSVAQQQEEKFHELLRELFMFDQADLDFGIYRVINARRGEITRFLDHDLLPQVRQALAGLEDGDRAKLAAEVDRAEQQARDLGVDPDAVKSHPTAIFRKVLGLSVSDPATF